MKNTDNKMNDTGNQTQIPENNLSTCNSESTALNELSAKFEHLDIKGNSHHAPPLINYELEKKYGKINQVMQMDPVSEESYHQVDINATVSPIELPALNQEKVRSVNPSQQTEKIIQKTEEISEEKSEKLGKKMTAMKGDFMSGIKPVSGIKEAELVPEVKEVGSVSKQEVESTSNLEEVLSAAEMKQTESVFNLENMESFAKLKKMEPASENSNEPNSELQNTKSAFTTKFPDEFDENPYDCMASYREPPHEIPSDEPDAPRVSMSSIAAEVIRQHLIYKDPKTGKWGPKPNYSCKDCRKSKP